MTDNLSYTLLVASVLATLVAVWNVKAADLTRQTITSKTILSALAVLTLIISIVKLKHDRKKTIDRIILEHRKDSVTMSILMNTMQNTDYLTTKTDSIVKNLETTSTRMIAEFSRLMIKQQLMLKESVRLQNPIPEYFYASFQFALYNDKLWKTVQPTKYHQEVYFPPLPYFGGQFKTDSYNYVTGLFRLYFQWFSAKVVIVNPNNPKQILLSTKGDIDPLKHPFDGRQDGNELKTYITLKAISGGYFQFNVINIRMKVLNQNPDVVSLNDLEFKTF